MLLYCHIHTPQNFRNASSKPNESLSLGGGFCSSFSPSAAPQQSGRRIRRSISQRGFQFLYIVSCISFNHPKQNTRNGSGTWQCFFRVDGLVWSGPMQNNIITRDNLAQLHKTKRNPVKENRTVLQLYRERQTDHQITTTYSKQFHT